MKVEVFCPECLRGFYVYEYGRARCPYCRACQQFTDEEILSPDIDIRRPEDRALILGRRVTKKLIEDLLTKLEEQ